MMKHSLVGLAHSYWTQIVKIGDTVIDTTCGNGHDTLKLCQLALSNDKGKVYAFDIQEQAIKLTFHHLETHLPAEWMQRVVIEQRCHATFLNEIPPESVKLIVYNLGYLPKGDKRVTTQEKSTLESLSQAQALLQPGGMISMVFYPGHLEGAREQEAVLAYVARLSPKKWSCCQHRWINRYQAPNLLIVKKNESTW